MSVETMRLPPRAAEHRDFRVVPDSAALIRSMEGLMADLPPEFPDNTRSRLYEALAKAETRLATGGQVQLGCVIGPSGVGKSSLLNALIDSPVLTVSEARPTTRSPAALTWAGFDHPLIDELQIPLSMRHQVRPGLFERDSASDSLILIDTPPVGSVDARLDALTRMVQDEADFCIWVLTPDTYATTLQLAAAQHVRQVPAIVVLNKIDTLVRTSVRELMEDILDRMEQAGMEQAPVFAASCATKTGIEELANAVFSLTARDAFVGSRSRAELHYIANEVAENSGASANFHLADAMPYVFGPLIDSTGVFIPTILRGDIKPILVGQAEANNLRTPSQHLVEELLNEWTKLASPSTATFWRQTLERHLPSPTELRLAVRKTVLKVPTIQLFSHAARLLWILGTLFIVAGSLAPFILAAADQLSFLTRIAVGEFGIVAGFACHHLARKTFIASSRNRIDGYRNEVINSLTQLLASRVVQPSLEVAGRHASVLDRAKNLTLTTAPYCLPSSDSPRTMGVHRARDT